MIKKILATSILSLSLLFTGQIVYAADDAYSNEVNIITDTESNNYYKLKTLIVTSTKPLSNTYNAIAAENCGDVIQILQYDSEEDTKNAYYNLKQSGYEVSVDQLVDIEHNNYDTGSYIDTLNVVQNLQLDKAQKLTSGKDEFRIAVFDYPYNKIDYPNDRVITESNSTKYTAYERDSDGSIVYNDSGYPNYVEYDIDFSKGSNNHGTYITGILLDSTSSNVKIYSYNAGIDHYYQSSSGEKHEQPHKFVADIISELDKVIEDNCKVVNMSIQWTISNTTIQKQIKAILDKLHSNGIIIVAAAGNDSSTISSNSYPQCLDYTINVSSVGRSKIISSFSNTGNIDFCAPGERIPTICGKSVSGTSFASPYITAFITEILQINNYNNPAYEIENSLALYCEDLGSTGKDSYYGNGYPVFTMDLDLCKNGHSFKSTVIKPTCTSTGYTQNVCSICGLTTTTNNVAMLNHNYKLDHMVKPTCTNYGYSIYICTKCGHQNQTDIVEATGHTKVTETVKSTCKTQGYTKEYCSTCNTTLYSATLPINRANHVYKDKYIDATCQHGKQLWHICLECGLETLVDTVSDPIDHKYVNNICKYCNSKKSKDTTTTTELNKSSDNKTTTEKSNDNQTVTNNKSSYVKVTKISKKKTKLSWKKIKKAKSYQLQISTNKKFKSKYTKKYSTKKCNYTVKNLKKNKTYYIRVRAKYSSKKYGSWKTITKYRLK